MEKKCPHVYDITIYRKDYVPKPVQPFSFMKAENIRLKLKNKEYQDPVQVPYAKYLTTEEPTAELSEQVDSYYERAKLEYPWMKQVSNDKSVDKNLVDYSKIFSGRSMYQVDFSNLEKEVAYKAEMDSKRVRLPSDVDIPLTVQSFSYRNPITMSNTAYQKELIKKYKSSLDPNYKIRKILNVTTGITEYMAVTSQIGRRIIREELHGIRHYPN